MAIQAWLIGGFTNIGVWVVHPSCVCEGCGADLWHGQQSKGTAGRTWCWTAGCAVVPLYRAFLILGNGTNKGSLQRGSPVELLGIQAQRNQKNFCTIVNGKIVGFEIRLLWINKRSLYAKYYCNCRLMFWLPYQGRCILNGIFVCLTMERDRK